MKAISLAVVLTLMAGTASAAVLCQSNEDPNYRACFPGWTCPFGFFQVGSC